MKAEVIAVGTELLMGYTVNTNASEIARELLEIGIGTYYQSVVGDNRERIVEALALAQSRSDVIVLSGGLGPTEDDVTKQVLAEFLSRKLTYDDKQLEKMEAYFNQTHRPMTSNNKRQALVIDGAVSLPNDVGWALGTIVPVETAGRQQYYILLPGPPFEMRHMLTTYVKPYLIGTLHGQTHILSRYLNFYGIGESLVADTLSSLIEEQTNPTIALYAKPKQVTVRLTANSQEEAEAEALLAAVVPKIITPLSEFYIGEGNEQSYEAYVVDLLRAKGKLLAVAESLTGGLVLERLTEVAGASEVIAGGFVTYQTAQKTILLGVDQTIIEQYSVVSSEVAREMAENTRSKAGTDFAIALTGVAGPATLDGHEVGEVFVAIAIKDEPTLTKHLKLGFKPRDVVREIAMLEALNLVVEQLNKEN